MKKSSVSESSSDIMDIEEGILMTELKKPNCNPQHNNNIHPACMTIETDVWLLGKLTNYKCNSNSGKKTGTSEFMNVWRPVPKLTADT